MNLQPYRMIIVRDAEVKESLSQCMSKKNENTVKEAAASIIVCSDMRGKYSFSIVTCRVGQVH